MLTKARSSGDWIESSGVCVFMLIFICLSIGVCESFVHVCVHFITFCIITSGIFVGVTTEERVKCTNMND